MTFPWQALMTSRKTPPPDPPRAIRAVFAAVAQQPSVEDEGDGALAISVVDEVVYVARGRAGLLGSAVFRLVLGLHEHFGENAHLAVRQRVWSNQPRTRFDRAVVQVGASKLSSSVDALSGTFDWPVRFVDEDADLALARATGEGFQQGFGRGGAAPTHEDWEMLKTRAAGTAKGIAAGLIVDQRLVAVAGSLGETNAVLHAEICLLAGWFASGRELLPRSSTLLTTLSPCRMCAAALVAACGDYAGDLEVIYAARDSGRLAQATQLHELKASRLREDVDDVDN